MIFAAAGAWVALGSYHRTIEAKGLLITATSSAKILASRTGVVTQLFVKDGDVVREGQTIATVRVEQASDVGAGLSEAGQRALEEEQKLALARASLARRKISLQDAAVTGIVSSLRSQRAKVSKEAKWQGEVVRSEEKSFRALDSVVSRGWVSKIEYERRRESYLQAVEQQAQLETQAEALNAEVVKVEQEGTAGRMSSQDEILSSLSTAQGLQEQRLQLQAQHGYTISAPVAGRVTALQTGLGRAVGGPVPLMSIVPLNAEIEAEIYLPSRAIGFVRVGERAKLEYDAFPYQRYGSFDGGIISVSRVALSQNEADVPFKVEEPVYKAVARIDHQDVLAYGKRYSLKPGMTLTASIVLDQQPFWDWLMSPFRAASRG
ncbi:MAG TPA: HlyD family efflux transporter periplasmic adaptor subunit [Allosphingosinicella sp.]